LLRLALSRTRELDADATALELTGDSEALIAVLDKLERHNAVCRRLRTRIVQCVSFVAILQPRNASAPCSALPTFKSSYVNEFAGYAGEIMAIWRGEEPRPQG
jgi:Zn-dependent protease with chaperone function